MALDPATWPLAGGIAAFVLAAVLITVFGIRMTVVAAQLAERTGLGEALMGALFVGASTSLAEITTSVTAAAQGYPDLAVGNAVGSIAGQTAFLAVVDMTYRRANLEHAAASVQNLMLGALLVTLLALPLLAMAFPEAAVGFVHPATPVALVVYVWGLRLVAKTGKRPMWHPRMTRETRPPDAESVDDHRQSLAALWLRFGLAAAVVGAAGWLLAEACVVISHHTALSETAIGALLAGLAGSIPEFVTALTAVRLGKLTLAVGDVIGGNAFDTLVVALSDVAYTGGSIYAALAREQLFLIALTMLLTGILLIGMLRREQHGIGNIGTESFLVLALYAAGFAVLVLSG